MTPLPDVAKRCKISVPDAKAIHDKLLKEAPTTELTLLNEVEGELDDVFSTGDRTLDQALGGGIRTGMVWEICGERYHYMRIHTEFTAKGIIPRSSAGKTQLALQISLSVQLPFELGGISGSTCYLTTSAKLPTGRLKQLSEHHPSFHPSYSEGMLGLQNVHTLSTSTIPILDNVLTTILPNFIRSKQGTTHPIKLVVIDALTELFHSSEKTTKTSIFTRSKDLNRIASALHNIASTHDVAILVLNEVIDRFDRSVYQVFRPSPKTQSSSPHDGAKATSDDLVYSEKSRWFNTCNSITGEDRKEASLGLVWANQLNVRIMLTRTGRRRYIDDLDPSVTEQKKAKLSNSPAELAQAVLTSDDGEQQATLVRRLSVVFSSVAAPISLDYVVTTEGVRILADEMLLEELKTPSYAFANEDANPSAPSTRDIGHGAAPTASHIPSQSVSQSQAQPKNAEEEDEWDRYWEAEDEISQHFDDFDALEMSLTQAPQPQEEEPEQGQEQSELLEEGVGAGAGAEQQP